MRRLSASSELRLIPILLTALVAFAAGCASNTEPVEEPQEMGSEFEDAAPAPPPREVPETNIANRTFNIAPVYFDFDESAIKPEFESILSNAATALRETGRDVVIEGHCDERGSDEYNLALGERRANAVRSYLYNLGVPRSQMSIVSYGEARPAVNGTGETVWQLNRRAEFVIR